MKTAFIKEIDGYEIITGFDNAAIDKEATKKIVNEKLEKIDATIKFIEEKSRHDKLYQELIKENRKPNNAEKVKTIETAFHESESKMNNHLSEMTREKQRLTAENLVYFEPKRGEILLDDEIAPYLQKKFEQLDDESALTKDGKVIPNFKGTEYWTNKGGWKRGIIEKIGEPFPEGGILAADITPEQGAEIADQLEVDRIAGLPGPTREAEKEAAIKKANSDAAHMRSMFEIDGIPSEEALSRSQKWFKEQKKAIEKKYK